MTHYCEDFTKRVWEETGDKTYRVEFNDKTQKYELLKWIPRHNWQLVPGYLFDSDQELVMLRFPSGYYSVQKEFPVFDARVWKWAIQYRADRRDIKEILHSMTEHDEKVEKKLVENKVDYKNECKKDGKNYLTKRNFPLYKRSEVS
jgi:hypothetical protein